MLFKDEVRQLGFELGLSRAGYASAVPGRVSASVLLVRSPREVRLLREADAIFREEIAKCRSRQGDQPVFCRF